MLRGASKLYGEFVVGPVIFEPLHQVERREEFNEMRKGRNLQLLIWSLLAFSKISFVGNISCWSAT